MKIATYCPVEHTVAYALRVSVLKQLAGITKIATRSNDFHADESEQKKETLGAT